MTGGRLRRVAALSRGRERVLLHLRRRRDRPGHRRRWSHSTASRGGIATVTAVQPPGRFGAMHIDGALVETFEEKPRGDGSWMNGGFFVLSPEVARYLVGDRTVWEQEPLRALARDGQLACFRHDGFWHPMDTLRDRNDLQACGRPDARPGARGHDRDRSSGATGACCSPATPGSRAAGWRCGCSRWAPGVGLSLPRADRPSLYDAGQVGRDMAGEAEVDIRDAAALEAAVARLRARGGHPPRGPAARPPLVRRAARDVRHQRHGDRQPARGRPRGAGRARGRRRDSDKCYENRGWEWGYREDEPMGGHDPYSSSKGAAELVTAAYRRSFFFEAGAAARRLGARGQRDRRRRLGVRAADPRPRAGGARRHCFRSATRRQCVLGSTSSTRWAAISCWPKRCARRRSTPPGGTSGLPKTMPGPWSGWSSGCAKNGTGGRSGEPDRGTAPSRGPLPQARLLTRSRTTWLAPVRGTRSRAGEHRRLVSGIRIRQRHARGDAPASGGAHLLLTTMPYLSARPSMPRM